MDGWVDINPPSMFANTFLKKGQWVIFRGLFDVFYCVFKFDTPLDRRWATTLQEAMTVVDKNEGDTE